MPQDRPYHRSASDEFLAVAAVEDGFRYFDISGADIYRERRSLDGTRRYWRDADTVVAVHAVLRVACVQVILQTRASGDDLLGMLADVVVGHYHIAMIVWNQRVDIVGG